MMIHYLCLFEANHIIFKEKKNGKYDFFNFIQNFFLKETS